MLKLDSDWLISKRLKVPWSVELYSDWLIYNSAAPSSLKSILIYFTLKTIGQAICIIFFYLLNPFFGVNQLSLLPNRSGLLKPPICSQILLLLTEMKRKVRPACTMPKSELCFFYSSERFSL